MVTELVPLTHIEVIGELIEEEKVRYAFLLSSNLLTTILEYE